MGNRRGPGVWRGCRALCEAFPRQSVARPTSCDQQEPQTGPKLFREAVSVRPGSPPKSRRPGAQEGLLGGQGPSGALGP